MSSLSLPIPAPTGGRGLALITALGVTQVAGYGGLYYAFAVLAPKMTESFGWSPEWTYGGFAAGLLIGGLVAPVAGRLIDHYGTRLMMTLGSVLPVAETETDTEVYAFSAVALSAALIA